MQGDDPEPQFVEDYVEDGNDDSDEEVRDSEAEGFDEPDEAQSAAKVPASTGLVRLTRANFRKNSAHPILIDYATLIYNCLPNQQCPKVSDDRKMEFFVTLLGNF